MSFPFSRHQKKGLQLSVEPTRTSYHPTTTKNYNTAILLTVRKKKKHRKQQNQSPLSLSPCIQVWSRMVLLLLRMESTCFFIGWRVGRCILWGGWIIPRDVHNLHTNLFKKPESSISFLLPHLNERQSLPYSLCNLDLGLCITGQQNLDYLERIKCQWSTHKSLILPKDI